MTYTGSDTAYPQGASGGMGQFNITCATRANVGLQVDAHYNARVDNTLAATRELGHYHFNDASVDANQQADFLTANLYRYAPEQMLALDVEYESVNGHTVTQAMNPTQAGAFFDRLQNNTGAPYTGMACYLNRSIRSQWDWTPVWERGVRKWIASPGADPGDWDLWQFGEASSTDQDYSTHTLAEFYGGSQPTKGNSKVFTVVHPYSGGNWVALITPAANGKLHATVLFSGDNSTGMAQQILGSQSWEAFKKQLDNDPASLPA